MRIDIMTDIETLGNKADSTIFQISAIAFDLSTGQQLAEFNKIANIAESKNLKITGDTLKWWLDTDKELLTALLKSGEGTTLDLLYNFHTWLTDLKKKGELFLWGNGILFDNKMIELQFQNTGLTYPIFFRNDRDVRTILELAAIKSGSTVQELRSRFDDESLTHHNAIDDVKYQIRLVVWCYNFLIETSNERSLS